MTLQAAVGGLTLEVRRLGVLAAALLSVAVLVAACGGNASGPGVASVGSGSPSAATSGGSSSGDVLAYAACMRSHGLKDFPDPTSSGSSGHLTITVSPGSDLNPHSVQFQAAQKACQSLLPRSSTAEQAQTRATDLKFAACMRSHGIADFPDPNPQGGFDITVHGPNSDLNEDNPNYQSALKVCVGILPGGVAP